MTTHATRTYVSHSRGGETVDVEEFHEAGLTHDERVAIYARLDADPSERPSAARVIARVMTVIAEQPARRPRRETSAIRPAVGERAAKTPRNMPRRLIVPLTGIAEAIVAALLWWTGAFTQAAWSLSIAAGAHTRSYYRFAQVMSAAAQSSSDGS